MGNAIAITTYLNHECVDKREAVEAGESLVGKIVVVVKKSIEAKNLNLELNGIEKSSIVNGESSSE